MPALIAMTSLCRYAVFAVSMAASALPAAAEGTTEALRHCRQVVEAQVRIACYDAIPLTASPATRASAPVPSALAATGASQTADPSRTSSAAPAATGTTVTPIVQESTDPNFGLPARPLPAAKDSVETAIDGHFDGWLPDTKFNLANGQVWRINDGSTAAYSPRRDAKVRITRGLLGSYFIQFEGVSQTPRVMRLK